MIADGGHQITALEWDGWAAGRFEIRSAVIHTFPAFYSSTYNDSHRTSLMLHEIGHIVGLGHPSSNPISIMNSNPANVVSIATIQPFDRESVRLFYNQ
jgi:hypothetical protein